MHKPVYRKIFFASLIILAGLPCLSQLPDFSRVPNLHPGDTAAIARLVYNGVKIRRGAIIAWFPKDSLPARQMNRIVDTLNIGVKAAEKIIGNHAWQVHRAGEPYTFYFRSDSFVSHASGAGFVSIPFWRIREGKAPWLHEAAHELLAAKKGNWQNPSVSREEWVKNMPLWLYEGTAEYISIVASQRRNLPHFDVQINTWFRDIDSLCKQDLQNEKADYILSFVGKKGGMPELFGKDRRLYAPAFYHLSCSFVKYLAEQAGLQLLITSLSAYPDEQAVLEKSLPLPIDELKRSWLAKIRNL